MNIDPSFYSQSKCAFFTEGYQVTVPRRTADLKVSLPTKDPCGARNHTSHVHGENVLDHDVAHEEGE